MAYASKYYDPVKAHEYYMKTRELKGYEDRYGGARGNGTSAASGGYIGPNGEMEQRGGASASGYIGGSSSNSSYSSGSTSKSLTPTQKHNQDIKSQIQGLRDQLKGMSKEDRAANREAIQDQIQSLREQTKGGSTSGFNQKGMEAAAYIKDQMDRERDEVIKKSNKDADNEMLNSVKRLAADIQAMRASGRGVSHQEFAARIKALTGQTKKAKIKAKRKHTQEYQQKYKDEIDKLRQDKSMYSYYDNKEARVASTAGKNRSMSSGTIKKSAKGSLNIADYLDEDTKRMAIGAGMSVSGDLSDTMDDNWLRQYGRQEDTSTKAFKEEYDAMSDEEKNSDYGRDLRSTIQYNEAVNAVNEERMRRLGI